jgi:DNA-binding GntR family transcriptional regulator
MITKPDLARVKRAKIKEQIAGRLCSQIARGVWPPGFRIPAGEATIDN